MGRGRSGRERRPQVMGRQQQQPEQAQQPQQPRTAQEWLDYFDTADDDAANRALETWNNEQNDPDNRSNDTPIQRFFHNIGWTNNVPEVMDETQYQAAWRAAGRPQQLYHSDHDAGNATAQDFANQFFGRSYAADGTAYRHYLSNGIFGDGTYFATSARGSAGYGTNQFRGFLNNNARVITYRRLLNDYTRYANAHPGFGRMMSRVYGGYGDDDERLSIYAAMRGYNVIDNESGYYAVLDRRAMTVSTQQRRTMRGMRNW